MAESDHASGTIGTPLGDSLSFYQLDASGNGVGYRPLSSVGNPDHWVLDNDPNAGDNLGKIEQVFVDQDTGDIISIESGYQDGMQGIDTQDREPAVIRRHVTTYDNGSGQIQLGGYVDMGTGGTLTNKLYLSPAPKDPNDTLVNPASGYPFVERGQWTAYDSKNDVVYFVQPGEAEDDALKNFAADIYVLDLKTGLTTSYMNVAASYSLFNGNPYDNIIGFVSLGLTGDYNGNGIVDAADYTMHGEITWVRTACRTTVRPARSRKGLRRVEGQASGCTPPVVGCRQLAPVLCRSRLALFCLRSE